MNNPISLENDSSLSKDTMSQETSPVFFNRELSWIDFNERVLGEGLRPELPPLERLKFLSIVSSNFDEFFMVRVASLKRGKESGGSIDPSGQTPEELLEIITQQVRAIMWRKFDALMNEVLPELEKGGLCIRHPEDWTGRQ